MAVVVGDAAVRLRPETGKFASEADNELSGALPGVAKKAAGFFAAAFAAVKIGGFLKDAVSEASDLSESASKVGVVFGDAGQQVLDFAENASTAFGQSRAQALEAAGTFGNLLRSLGLTEQASADMSTSFVGLASDLASFNNTDPAEALDALRAGLTGETEPLKRYGINLNQAAIAQEAVRLGLAAAGEELTAQAKAQASYSLIMQQSSLAQGDFARTSAGLANQQRIVAAQFTDLQANIGGLFVPVLGNAAGALTGRLMPALLEATSSLPELGNALGMVGDVARTGFSDGLDAAFALGDEFEGLARWPIIIAANLGDLSAIFREVFADGQAGASMLADSGIEGFVANLGVAAAQVRDALVPAFELVRSVAGPALAEVSTAFSSAFGGEGGGSFVTGFVGLLQQAVPLIVGYVTRWAEVFAAAIPIIADILTGLAPVISGLVQQIGPLLQSLVPVFSQVAGVFAQTILAVLQALGPVIPPLVQAIGQVAQVLAGALLQVLQMLAPILPVLVEAIAEVAVALADALGGALQAIIPVLPPLIDALIQLVLAALTPLLPILPTIARLISGLIAAVAPLLPAVAQLVGQLINLALMALQPILPLLPTLANLLVTIFAALTPLLDPLVQIIALIVQLAIQAVMPLMPLITTLTQMFARIVPVLMPIISVFINLVSTLLNFGSKLLGGIIGFVSGIIGKLGDLVGWFVGLPGRILSAVGNFARLLWNKGVELIQGLVDGIASAASYVGNIAKNIVNGIIDWINSNIIDGINSLLEFEIAGIEIDVPDIPHIPRLHEGGVFDSGQGEGFALLRDQELVATPEQRRIADDLLRGLLDGRLPAGTDSALAAGSGLEVNNYITQQPGENGEVLAARVTQDVVWRLNAGATRRVGAGVASPA